MWWGEYAICFRRFRVLSSYSAFSNGNKSNLHCQLWWRWFREHNPPCLIHIPWSLLFTFDNPSHTITGGNYEATITPLVCRKKKQTGYSLQTRWRACADTPRAFSKHVSFLHLRVFSSCLHTILFMDSATGPSFKKETRLVQRPQMIFRMTCYQCDRDIRVRHPNVSSSVSPESQWGKVGILPLCTHVQAPMT